MARLAFSNAPFVAIRAPFPLQKRSSGSLRDLPRLCKTRPPLAKEFGVLRQFFFNEHTAGLDNTPALAHILRQNRKEF